MRVSTASRRSRSWRDRSVDFRQALITAANEVAVITENGRKGRLSKQQVAARQLVNKAASADHRAIELLCKYLGSNVAAEPVAAPPAEKSALSFGSEDDAQVLEAFLQRLKKESSS